MSKPFLLNEQVLRTNMAHLAEGGIVPEMINFNWAEIRHLLVEIL